MFEVDGFIYSFGRANERSNGIYSITCKKNDIVILCRRDNGCSVILESKYPRVIGDEYGISFVPYFDEFTPTKEQYEKWMDEFKDDRHFIRDEFREALAQFGADNNFGDPVPPEHLCPLPEVPDLEAVKAEMISKVNITRLRQIMSVACNNDNLNKTFVTEEIAMQYLDEWATKKAPIYLMFGNKLKIEREISVEKSPDEIVSQIKAVTHQKYNNYMPGMLYMIEQMPSECVARNEANFVCFPRESLNQMESLTGKNKITTLLHAMYKNEQFDADIAKVYQDDHFTKTIAISIDPYDFLTMSENQHGWKSCHNIHMGGYTGGGFAYMTDGATAIAYMYDGTNEYKYELNGFHFKGNSKEWRQCVYISGNTRSAIFSRQYPRVIPDVQREVIDLYKSVIGDAEVKSQEVKSGGYSIPGYERGSYMCYHDAPEGNYEYTLLRTTAKKRTPKFLVGGKTWCLICGDEITELYRKRMLCADDYRANETSITKEGHSNE